MKYVTTKVPTKSAKVSFSPGIKLSIISHSSTVSVASRRTDNNLTETENVQKNNFYALLKLVENQ